MKRPQLYETSAPKVYLVRDPSMDSSGRAALLDQLRAASRGGALAVVLELDGEVDPSSAAFWMSVLQDRHADVGAIAVVVPTAAGRLAIRAFAALVALRHLPAEVRAFPDSGLAITWAAEALARAAAARRLAGSARA